MEQQKTNIIQTIDRMQHELLALSHQIHDHPELGYEEHQAVASIRSFLEDRGFQVETPYCGLDTSFKVVKKRKRSGTENCFSCGIRCAPRNRSWLWSQYHRNLCRRCIYGNCFSDR